MEKYKSYIYKNKYPNLRKTALLIIDAQYALDFYVWHIAENLNVLSSAYRKKGVPIIWLQHMQRVSDKNTMYRSNSNHLSMKKDTRYLDFCSCVHYEEGDPVIVKTEFDAFYKTDLNLFLKELGILELVIAGAMTNLSCDSTARTAVTLNYKVHIVSDATIASDEYIQDATLATLAHSFAYVHSSSELLQHSERSKVKLDAEV